MSLDAFKNFALGTLSSGINSSATSLSVTSGQGARFPITAFNATIYNSTDYADAASAYYAGEAEIVRVTGISTDTFTIARAQEGTSAVNLNTGGKTYTIVAGLTAAQVESLRDPFEQYIIEDFNVFPGPWVQNETANGGSFAANTLSEYYNEAYGMANMVTGTNAAGHVAIRAAPDMGVGAGEFCVIARVSVENLPASGQDFFFQVGGKYSPSSWDNFAASLYCSNASANWYFGANYGGTNYGSVDTGIAVTTSGFHRLETRMDWSTHVARAYINGVKVGEITGIASLTPTIRQRPMMSLSKLSGTTSRTIIVDKFGYRCKL